MFSRPIDHLGRIVIPKEIRDALNWLQNDKITILQQGKKLLLGKFEFSCALCGTVDDLVLLPERDMICASCMKLIAKSAQVYEHTK